MRGEECYFVAVNPESGIIGTLTATDIRQRLASGKLAPTFVCLPIGATGFVANQWRLLGDMFGPDGCGDPPGLFDSDGTSPPIVPAEPSGDGLSPTEPEGSRFGRWIEDAFLVFGQIICVLICCLVLWRMLVKLYTLNEISSLAGFEVGDDTRLRVLILVEGLCAFGFLMALLVTFRRVQRGFPRGIAA